MQTHAHACVRWLKYTTFNFNGEKLCGWQRKCENRAKQMVKLPYKLDHPSFDQALGS